MLYCRKVQPDGEGEALFTFEDFRFEQDKARNVL